MVDRLKFKSHEHYIESAAIETQDILLHIQRIVENLVPDASRCISYNIPAYKLEKTFFYFAAFKKHIGIYPPVTSDKALIKELRPYRNIKGNLIFPLNQEIPYELIGRVALTLSREYSK